MLNCEDDQIQLGQDANWEWYSIHKVVDRDITKNSFPEKLA
jgi:hypothetical protein